MNDQSYELLDFGEGRKLERFGRYVLDRPCPGAATPRGDASRWSAADARFEARQEQGVWRWRGSPPESWVLRLESLALRLKPTPFGHLGVFPEQRENWTWLREAAAAARRPLRVLNLFAYTGGSTLAAAAGGAAVAHVDAAANIVRWARENAELNALQDAPVRWIAEDAATFVHRELKRGRAYDGLILDPPSFGRGPKGQQWRLRRDLRRLMSLAVQLLADEPRLVLFTCHSLDMQPRDAARLIRSCFPRLQAACQSGELRLSSADSPAPLTAGVYARAFVD